MCHKSKVIGVRMQERIVFMGLEPATADMKMFVLFLGLHVGGQHQSLYEVHHCI